MSARINRGGSEVAPDQINRAYNSISAGPPQNITSPVIDLDLLTYLNTVFPDRLSLVDRLGCLDAARGARAVVEHLTTLYEEQNDHVPLRQQVGPGGADRPGPGATAA